MSRRLIGALLFTVASLAPLGAAQDATFIVGTANAARGQTATGAIEVPAGSDAAL